MSAWNGRDRDGSASSDGGTGYHRPLEVRVGERGLEGALRLFKKLVLGDGLLRNASAVPTSKSPAIAAMHSNTGSKG